jgi:curved DNA-binding protein CbpA
MTSQSNLEIKGNLREHPLAELLLEISQTNLSGSIRLAGGDRKAVIYLSEGNVVFAVSNQRQHRLFEILVREKRFSAQQIVEIPQFTNDLELGKNLMRKQLMTKAELDDFFVRQIKEILQSVFVWTEGEWIFSSLARVRENIYFYVNLQQILIDYARSLSSAKVSGRFKSLQESFRIKANAQNAPVNFLPREQFVLSRFEVSAMKIEEVKSLSGLSAPETFHVLYVLWLGGFLSRQGWNTAFSERKISDILTAKISLKKEEASSKSMFPQAKTETPKPIVQESVKPVIEENKPSEPKATLEEYLSRTEAAANHYETLGVAPKAVTVDIKKAYFAFAKQFHPDLYHRQTDAAMHARIQGAFTKIAQAYEVLKDEKSREVYDFKLRKELADAESNASSSPETVDLQGQAKMAEEYFKSGFGLLMEEHYEDALPYLGRAVHLAPENARYHAFYGKALSFDETQRHKAESEMQSAVKLDPKNETYRIILAEFFIQYNLLKRAEGELKRLLTIAPDNSEAKALLDSLRNK